MAFVQFSKVSLAFGDRDILLDVSLNLASGSKAALAGANGAGKTTLMKVIAGIISADSGDRAVQKGTRISYLPQSGIVHRGKTLREEAETSFSEITDKLAKIDELGHELEKISPDSPDSERRIAGLLAEHHRLGEEVEASGYYRREAAVSVVLKGLGFEEKDNDRNVEEFSGGWQMRIALAKVLLYNPDILLLDEPTNYLDIEARTWLEEWLQSFTGGYLLVSHDRWFLDQTVNEVYEIFRGDCRRYIGNYSAYEKTRETELEILLKRYAAQQEEIEKTEALINRFRYKASKAAFAQELIKRLDKMERIEIPENLKKMSITFPPPPHSGRVALTLSGIGRSYGTNRVLSGLDLTVESGERLLVAGRNGAGKSTLLRIIAGIDTSEQVPPKQVSPVTGSIAASAAGTNSGFEGEVKYGSGISPGYFSQDAAETITGNRSVMDYMEAEAPTYLIPKIRDMLGAFLFRGDDVYKSLSVLSGGEKSRLALLHMLLKPLNLLILDEPTNHLDLHSKDILLDCLKAFKGTIIFVSHDRGFMEALSTKTLGLGSGRHRLYYGGYAYYLERVTNDSDTDDNPRPQSREPAADTAAAAKENIEAVPAPEIPKNAAAGNSSNPKTILIKAGSQNSAEYRIQEKQRQAVLRQLKRREADILAALDEAEKEKSRLEAELARPEVYSSAEKARAAKLKLDRAIRDLEAKTLEWETAVHELSRLDNSAKSNIE